MIKAFNLNFLNEFLKLKKILISKLYFILFVFSKLMGKQYKAKKFLIE